MFFVNNPPRWLARALAIVNGQTQTEIEDRLYPVVDAVQGGWGLASIISAQINGSLGSVVTHSVTADQTQSKLVAVEHNNPDTATSLFTIALRVRQSVSVRYYRGITAINNVQSMNELSSGQRWFAVPPECALEITQQPYATNAGFIRVIEVTLPGGVNLS